MKLLAFTLLILSAFVIGQQVQDRSKGTKYATLVEWIQRNDGGLFSARIQSVPGMGMGVVTTKPVKVSCMLTRRTWSDHRMPAWAHARDLGRKGN